MSSNGAPSSSIPGSSRSLPQTAAADVTFTPRTTPPVESRIPRWTRSSRSKSPNSSDNNSSGSRTSGNGKRIQSSELASPPSNGKIGGHKSTPTRLVKSGGFLLDSVFSNGHLHQKERTRAAPHTKHVPHTQVERAKSAAHRVSEDSSRRGSPLSREVSNDISTADSRQNRASQSPSMDPAQLVQMALSLSESRKRHVSSTLPVPISPAGTRRVVSDLAFNKRSSLLSDSAAYSSPGSQRSSGQYGSSIENGVAEIPTFIFSPATLSRAEKARRYFELASEHRRLLEYLPPLKSDQTAPGNYTLQATSSPGSAHYDMTRVPSSMNVKRELGRSYNPLQSLRNRRLRNRERRPMPAPPETWHDTDRIKAWIDGVEIASKDPSYRPGSDTVRLPSFSGELVGDEQLQGKSSMRHRRTGTATSVVTRHENGWTIEPAERLADAYWLEKSDNKAIVEDRHGNRIFPNLARASIDLPRGRDEYENDSDRRDDAAFGKNSLHDETEDDDHIKGRRRHMLPIPGLHRRKHVSRSASVSSSSSDDQRRHVQRFGESTSTGENTGPLERHMRNMMAKEANGELSSPEILSPDHWDSKHKRSPEARGSTDRTHRGSVSSIGDRLSADFSKQRKARSADGRTGSLGNRKAPLDDVAVGDPDSSNGAGLAHPATLKHAPSTSRLTDGRDVDQQEVHRPDKNHIDRHDFADNFGTQLSPVLSGESSSGPGRASLDISRPPKFRRHKTSDSVGSGLQRSNTSTTAGEKSIKEGSSIIGRRFLKAGRIGEIVRTEGSRIGDRLRGGRDRSGEVSSDFSKALSDSDAEENTSDPRSAQNVGYDSEVSPRGSLDRQRPKARYHTSGLPTFKSSAAAEKEKRAWESAASDDGDAVFRQRTRNNDDRSDSPAAPTIKLPADDSASLTDASNRRPNNSTKSVSQQHLSFGALPAIKTGDRRNALVAGHEGRRHWSISDQTHQQQSQSSDKVTARDIARIRALLLASGIKAHEIYKQAHAVNDKPSPLMLKIMEGTGSKMNNVTRKEECLFAGRLLSDNISMTLSKFETTVEHFQTKTAKDLASQLDDLSHRVSDQLTKLVHETSDEADAFNVELTTKQPQEVKRVDEAVDEMFRQRRRQFRLVRRTGFKMLEWLVLGVMWWLWFLVVLFNTARKAVVGGVRAFRWMVWF